MICATEFVCTINESANSAVFRCSDGHYYVVTFQGITDRSASLGTKFLTCKLASSIGLPTPDVEVVAVEQGLIDHSDGLISVSPWLQMFSDAKDFHGTTRKKVALQCGSRYLVEPRDGKLFDYFPETALSRVGNLNVFAGALAFDLWMKRAGARQTVFCRSSHDTLYNAAFLYHGWEPRKCDPMGCAFDPARVAMYRHKAVYQDISEWCDFEPFLSRVGAVNSRILEGIAGQIPAIWCDGCNWVSPFLRELRKRQEIVRPLLSRFLFANPDIFPNWSDTELVANVRDRESVRYEIDNMSELAVM